MKLRITLNINGADHPIEVEPRRTLVDAIREERAQTGTHIGCEHGVCGACTVLLDGEPVRACLMFAVQAGGRKIRTVEGLGSGGELHPVQRAFIEHHGLQCGYCTPGFLMLAVGTLERDPNISDAALLDVLSSNLCRCTGYKNIVKAVRAAADEMRRGCLNLNAGARSETYNVGREKAKLYPAETGGAAGSATLLPPYAYTPGSSPRLAPRAGLTSHTANGQPENAASQVKTNYIGQSVQRLEDLPLVTGRGRFAADVNFPNQLHMRIVRSGHAHAEILAVDVSQARAAAGVVAVWTAADIPELKPIALREGPDEKLDPYLQPVLANASLRYVGEPVAAVFAEDAYLAEDAAELVNIEVRELPPTLDAYATPVEFATGRSTEPLVMRKGYGDVESAFPAAHAVIELDLRIGRHSGVPLETRGAIACYDSARDLLQLYGAAKVPHRTRDGIAHVLGRAAQSVHLHEGHVGGGFGVRGEVYPEDVLVCLAALKLGRPVKWIEDRYEHLIAANHSREQRHCVRAAVDAAGRLLALDDEFYLDQGAYPRTHGARVLDMTSGMLPGPYHLPAYRATGHYRLTNKTPAATYRAPGRFEGAFVRERVLDAIADRLGLDRVEVRRRNLIPRSAMPYKRDLDALGDDVVLDSGDYHGLLDKALSSIGWEALQKDLARRRSEGEMVGAGIAFFVEKTGLGPRDGAHVNVDGEGNVEVVTGSSSLGQGVETVMAQICADALGVDYRRVQVVHGQTDRIARGIGAHASRATVMTGSAVHVAALNARAKAIEAAATMMDIPADTLDIVDGRVVRKDSPDAISIDLAEVARSLATEGRGPGLTAEGWFETAHMNYPYGVHLAVVRVDRDTGAAVVERFLIAYDLGRAINPMLVEGQLAGGFAQGLGGTLYEEFRYDANGQPLAVTFADYLIPTAREVPSVEVLISEDAPSPLNPLGIKGAGEGGVPGVGAAIAAAIDDAIGIAGAVTQLPVTPVRLKNILDANHGTT